MTEHEGTTFAAMVRRVHELRSEQQRYKDEWTERLACFERDNATLRGYIADTGAGLAAAEAELRTAAVNWYSLTAGIAKRPCPGVAIRVLRKVIYDAKRARLWCEEHRMFMTVEWKLFERFAKDNSDAVEGVVIEEEPQATIATDLAEAVAELEGAA